MFLRFGRNLMLAIWIALQMIALAVCPCQLGDDFRSAVAVSTRPGNTENTECYCCQVNSKARPVCRSSFLEREDRPAVIIRPTILWRDLRTFAQSVAVLPQVDLPVPDLADLQVFLE